MLYFTNTSKNKIEKNSIHKDIIYHRINDIEKRDSLSVLGNITSFVKNIYVLKISTPKIRIIIEEKINIIQEKDVKVYIIKDIVMPNEFDRIYRYILPRLKDGSWIQNNPISKEDEQKIISLYKNSMNNSIEMLKKPPENLTNWLSDFKLNLDNDVFETESWVEYALNSSQKDGMRDIDVGTFRILIEEIKDVNHTDDNIIKSVNGINILQYTKYSCAILYSKVKFNNKDIIILFNGANPEVQKEHWKLALKTIANIDIEPNIESISRNSYRSYPNWTLSNNEFWFAIQKSKEVSNLSLTTEQSSFFNNFKFPYYINGQAGSGKSTMLYYLFANVYYYKTQEIIQGDVVFLTENEKLLEDTKKYVNDLLRNNPEYDGLDNDEINESKKSFYSFKNFLLNILSSDDKKYFENDKYLDFSTFKNLYENSNLPDYTKKKYSAEESWFVIITYIYGYELDTKVTSKNYTTKIPKSSQAISESMFIGIEKDILPFYEKLLDDGYWDKLKIIRFITKNIVIDNKFSVIVCDEAQDFCRVELHFILNLSEYLQYDLKNIEQIPVLFAGDPNQTVNPTGFREDEMTSLLYTELKNAQFEYDQNNNVYSPILNYRSSHSIVSLANFIQYYRMKNFGIKQKQPQEAKRPLSSNNIESNIFLNYKDIEENLELKKDLKLKLKYKIFIVPVDSREKNNFIKNSTLLCDIDEAEVKTSIEAKGAEYKQVVLYGFGEYFLQHFNTLENDLQNEQDFKVNYFFNKLYVAITRAQTELIIIDSKKSKELFWEQLIDNINITNQKWKMLEKQKNNTIEYNTDTINNVLESTPDDALQNARIDKKQGEYNNNPARLKMASNQFFKLGFDLEAYESLAIAEKIKYNYKSAGEYYLKAEKLEEASMAYFSGRYFNDVEKIGNNIKTIEQDIRVIISKIMNQITILKSDIDILYKNCSIVYSLINELTWREDFIDTLFDLFYKLKVDEQKSFIEVLSYILKDEEIVYKKELATMHYNLSNYKEAIKYWEEIDYIDTKEYITSKIKLSEIGEEKAIWQSELLIYIDNPSEICHEIVKLYFNSDTDKLSKEYIKATYRAFIYLNDNKHIKITGEYTEKAFEDNLETLEVFYKNILNDKKLNSNLFSYIVERWAKIVFKSHNDSIDDINATYIQIAKEKKLSYKKFTYKELEKNSNYPQTINLKPNEHLKNIEINNFRCFKKLHLNNIGQFNLILGDNNIGKTSLLEALLFTDDLENYIKNILFAYTTRMNNFDILKEHNLKANEIIQDLINLSSDLNKFSFIINEGRNEWNIAFKIPTENELREKYGNNIDNINIDNYICKINNNKECDIKLLTSLFKKIKKSDLITTQYIPFGKGFDRDLVQAYSEYIDRDRSKRDNFLNAMKVFIPKIDRITIDTNQGKIYIEELDTDEVKPLHYYGEGSKKLFRILVQIVLQKEKKLLIDEIDAGIHYSHFREFWKVILKVAKDYNVQIFATTHNIECIEHFKDILEENDFQSYQELSKTITLKKLPDDNIKAYIREYNEFEYELDNELDIRGGIL